MPYSTRLAAEMAALLAGATTDEGRAKALLSLSAVFPPALVAEPRFVKAVTGAYLSLRTHGAVEAARRVVE